jgi:hypothetical protein
MFLVAVSFLNGTDDCTRFLCESGLRRAYEEDDRQELAKETLKVIRCVLGWSALDVELEISDQRRAFSQIRAKVPLPQLKEALNAPGIQHLTARDRAETLSKQGYGTTGAIERRARRLRKRRAPRKGTRSSS